MWSCKLYLSRPRTELYWKSLNIQLEGYGTLSLPISELWTHWCLLPMHADTFCILFETVLLFLFSCFVCLSVAVLPYPVWAHVTHCEVMWWHTARSCDDTLQGHVMSSMSSCDFSCFVCLSVAVLFGTCTYAGLAWKSAIETEVITC